MTVHEVRTTTEKGVEELGRGACAAWTLVAWQRGPFWSGSPGLPFHLYAVAPVSPKPFFWVDRTPISLGSHPVSFCLVPRSSCTHNHPLSTPECQVPAPPTLVGPLPPYAFTWQLKIDLSLVFRPNWISASTPGLSLFFHFLPPLLPSRHL